MSNFVLESTHEGQLFVVAYDFEAVETGQMTIRKGEILLLLEKDESGWWFGQIKGDDQRTGLFPFNYVEPYCPSRIDLEVPSGIIQSQQNALENASPMANPRVEDKKRFLHRTSNSSHLVAPSSETALKSPLNSPGNKNISPQDVEILMEGKKPPPPEGSPPLGARKLYTNIPVAPTPTVKHSKQASKDQAKEGKSADTIFRVYAHIMFKYGCSMLLFFLGLGGIIYGCLTSSLYISPVYEIAAGVLGFLYGIAIYIYEDKYDGEPLMHDFPLRGTIMIVTGMVLCPSFAQFTSGLSLICTGIVDIVGFARGEEFKAPRKERTEDVPVCERLGRWLWRQVSKGRVFVFCCIYIAGNLAAFIVTALIWYDAIAAMPEEDRLSKWAPFAKSFGAIIDINSSLILIPLCRTFMRWLYNISTSKTTCCAGVLQFIFSCIPLDKNHAMHKQLAGASLVGVIGHTVVHFINYALRPEPSVKRFGLWPFISGMILLVLMVFIYAGGFEVVRHGNFEIFWYSHHLFILYFLFTLVHGEGGWNPNFWKYFLIPGLLYLTERVLRAFYRGKKRVRVMSVLTMRPRLLALEFDKKSAFDHGFAEGMYIFLNCPSIRKYEWHPFTISSPPHKDTFTVHIQTQGKGSWTKAVYDYMLSLGPARQPIFKFTSRDDTGVLTDGRVNGPDGQQLFLIDGPHSAPTQHMSEYDHVFVCGAGIGLTPVASCVQSVVFHRWLFSIGKCYPSHAHFAWVVSYRDVKAYRWFVSRLKEVQDCVINMRKKSAESMKTKTFRFHIYVTSAPVDLTEARAWDRLEEEEKEDPTFWGLRAPEALVDVARADFSKMDLYKALLLPGKIKQLGDIHIHSGRPKWDPRFEELEKMHRGEHIGVMFCGNKFVGKSLKEMCKKYSEGATKFTLHKENF